jgi:hypothetical protein
MSRQERGLQSAFCIVSGLKSALRHLNIEKQQPIPFAYNTGRSNLAIGKICHS